MHILFATNMKFLIPAAILAFTFSSCSNEDPDRETEEIGVSKEEIVKEPVVDPSPADTAITYENERFRNVQVRTVKEKTFRITGEAQVFEAAFSWTIEDGHNVIKEGHETTLAGAPEWGSFDFTVNAEKERENSTLLLVLYEGSPKDGSRQHELPVPLY